MTLAYFQITAPEAIHYVPPKPWIIGGNLFSNFFEEFIFRGFLLAALTAVFGFWPAAILSSVAFGAVHTQYPMLLQLLVASAGFVYCIVMKLSRTLWAPWLSHMSLDLVIDMLIG
jgi:membrane protease YdiL (CAAX protease family)